jgi:hypothetical protein
MTGLPSEGTASLRSPTSQLSTSLDSFGLAVVHAGDKCGHDESRGLDRLGRARQQFLDFHGDAIAADDHRALRDRHVVGENADLILLGGIELDDGAAAEAKNLVDRHRGPAQHYGDIDRDII